MKTDRHDTIRLLYPAFLLALVMVIAISGCSQPAARPANATGNDSVHFIDSNGAEFTLPHAAQRIVATNSDCTEMLIAIGAADRIVGVSDTVYANPLLMKLLPANVVNVELVDAECRSHGVAEARRDHLLCLCEQAEEHGPDLGGEPDHRQRRLL